MGSNSFGQIFRITTWGESHGKAIGVVIDGCPAGLELTESEINAELALRAPGKSPYTSPRKEIDEVQILSGLFEGKTTGAPISLLIPNRDADSSKYEPIKHLVRPGHANETYLSKYGLFDYRGGGRASARETACRVAAGAVAKKFLHLKGIQITAYIKSIGSITAEIAQVDRERVYASEVHCPDPHATAQMMLEIKRVKAQGDSLGGIVEFAIHNSPKGLGDPIYAKLEALLASAMMSIPASKAFEIGSGFSSAKMGGAEHNQHNHAGGILGGISTGQTIVGRVAFKPTSSIAKPQATHDLEGNPATFQLPEGSRHDPCVAIRAVPVVEAMCALVMADALLMDRCATV